jgi:lambda family phage portal protein
VPFPKLAAAASAAWTVLSGAGGFEATKSGRRLSTMPSTELHVNALLAAEGATLRRRAREAVRNNPYAASACESFVGWAVGTGIKPTWGVDDPGLKREIQELWAAWTDESDADNATDFYGQQALACRAMFEAGECFIRLRDRRPEDGLLVPLQLQLLESEMLPFELNRDEPNGNVTRSGVEFDRIGRRQAYHFRRSHPGDQVWRVTDAAETVRVPASEVLHLYRPLRPGQIRGVPTLTASLVRLYLLDLFDDATLAKMQSTNLFGIAITRPTPEEGVLQAATPPVHDPNALPELRLEPNFALELAPGEEVSVVNPGEVGSSYEPFQYRQLTAIFAGMGVPYSSGTGDVSRANYSSLRAEQVDFRRRVEQFQWATLVFQLCRPTAHRWLDAAVLSGALSIPGYRRNRRQFQQIRWIPPAWPWVDPLKDRQAEQLAVSERWKARSDVVEAEGFDVDETDARIAADQAREEALGLVVPRPEPVSAAPAAEPEPAPPAPQERAA